MANEGEIVDAGWVSLSRSGKSLSIMVMNQMFFVPLSDLQKVLDKKKARASIKQWIEKGIGSRDNQKTASSKSKENDERKRRSDSPRPVKDYKNRGMRNFT